ncbi:MAG: succinylglutamate desuccinylase/aspartoacylase family protein [Acidimicrobiales bacterium]
MSDDTASVPPAIMVGGAAVAAGERAEISIPIGRLVTGERMSLPVMVLNGARPGPTVWINGAIHGDEIGGVEIITRVLRTLDPTTMAGTVLAVPVVNVHGFVTSDRYLPDRRDLNRSFPGSASGSLGAQVANLFMNEIVARCGIGIDLHTGSDHRTNLPQIRADLDDAATRHLAEEFGTPVVIHARTRDGSLRHAATKAGATVLLYEAGEASRFDEEAIRVGVTGVLRVFAAIGLIDAVVEPAPQPLVSRRTSWMRARRSGIVHLDIEPGALVRRRQELGTIDDTFGNRLAVLRAPFDGLVIGMTRHPLVNRGDAMVHIAEIETAEPAASPAM